MPEKSQYLDELYLEEGGQTFMTGIQALVRLPMAQRNLDRRHNLNTAGLVSGYRGSPLGAYDQQLWKAEPYLKAHDIVFQPGLNEDLAATALWGAQMHKAYGPSDVDGVFGIWYGKGNGVDRTGDAFRNANMLGTSALGGVLAVGGDDHAAQSSMFPHQTDGIFQSVLMPVLQPSSVSEILSLGLAGIALSRYSGLWVGMKTIAEVVESAAAFDLPDLYPAFQKPDMAVPARGFGWDPAINWPAERAEYERRMYDERLPAAKAWIAANRLDYPLIEADSPRLVVVSVGKSRQDVLEALELFGLSRAQVADMGVSFYHVAVSWPLAAAPLMAFARGAEEILVVEEKSATVEGQLKDAYYNAVQKPRIAGKTDHSGQPLLPAVGEFTPQQVAAVIAAKFGDILPREAHERLRAQMRSETPGNLLKFPARKPFFCAGCPHNCSTKTPDGSISGGGIGCHVMALSQPALKTSTFSQMGGEGMQWVGAAPFSKTRHIFQNIGDGTYQHSGVLAVRAAVAAKANITFKILYNDAVAMTGGQPAEGTPTPEAIVQQLLAEGVGEVCLVSDAPEKWLNNSKIPAGVAIEHREHMNVLQKRLRGVPGVTAIVYEQTCASEKRRRRKRGLFPDPDKRLFINPRICEGCGDCSVQSNCIAVEPLQTDYGRKRKINQSSCNKDFSCVKGFCPSFVEVDGPVLRKPDDKLIHMLEGTLLAGLRDPDVEPLEGGICNIFVAGIGGQGVLTIGTLLGTAAYRAGMEASVLDFTGLAQKNGAVVSEVRLAPKGVEIPAVRIKAQAVDLLLATDMVAASSIQAREKMNPEKTVLVLNSDVAPTADGVTDRDARLPAASMETTLRGQARDTLTLEATSLAEKLFGNAIAANMLILGYAWQNGLVPLPQEAIFQAVEINGAAVTLNKRAFLWGRLVAEDPARIEDLLSDSGDGWLAQELDTRSLADRRAADLTHYQDAAYAERYKALLAAVGSVITSYGEPGEEFLTAVTENAYKLMAYKDEYEVARLYSEPEFKRNLAVQFSDMKRVSVWLSPPLLSPIDPATGRPKKRKFGPWVFTLFRLLARLKGLRGTWADPFGYTVERRAERHMRDTYVADIEYVIEHYSEVPPALVLELANLPQMVRGFGPVKEAAIKEYHERRLALMADINKAIQSGKRHKAA